jgi:hypothetical protein
MGILDIMLWGFIASAAMAIVLEGSQLLGLSRLSLPFLFGTFVTSDRHRAMILGFVLYLLGGWAFAALYYLVFSDVGLATWWLGALLGLLHGAFLLVVFLPMLPHVHPRMASEFDDPEGSALLEPPGGAGLNYGRRTPLITLLGQLCYGVILGAAYTVAGS